MTRGIYICPSHLIFLAKLLKYMGFCPIDYVLELSNTPVQSLYLLKIKQKPLIARET